MHGLKTTDREGEIDKCFWQMERQHNGRTKIKKDAFYIFQWDERRRKEVDKVAEKQARSRSQSSLLQAFFSFLAQDCNKSSSTLATGAYRQRI